MEIKLHFNKILLSIGLLLMSYNIALTQTITNLTLDAGIANRASFTLTNGYGVNSNGVPLHFIASQPSMTYRFQLSTSSTFSNPGQTVTNLNTIIINNPPIGDGASESYERNFIVPNTFAPGIYYLRIHAHRGGQFNRYSNIIQVELFYDVSIEGLSDMGYVRCQTPAVSYRLATVKNTGNLPQAYDLSLDPNIAPTEQNLAFDILSFEGNPIDETPELSPGGAFSFLIRIAAIPGTQGSKKNYTALIATAQNDSNVLRSEVMETYIFCGNGNNIPNNPNAPDLDLVKSGPSQAVIGELMTYTITMLNNTTTEAIFPTITDSIPVNLDFVKHYQNSTEDRNIIVTFDQTSRVLQATFATNNIDKFVSGSLPITVYIDVIPNCHVTTQVTNTAFASNGADDYDYENNISIVNTEMSFDTSNQVDWTGRVNDDWFECANWDKGIVPNADINVTIPTISDNNPVIDSGSSLAPGNGTAEVRDITIMPDKTLFMNNSTLEVNGNWENNGTFSHGNGTVAFVGSIDQQIADILLGTPTFFNLKVNTTNNAKVLVPNDQGLFVNNQLNLENGVLRLEGLSQLIQPDGASVIANTGRLWRDQRGQANMFNYNYWSSPVGNGSNVYTITSAMKDGSDVTNPQNIQWTTNANVPVTNNPITISSRWLYKFESTGPLYANWQKIMPGTTLNAGQGYTMKGSGNPHPSGTQNYIFVGVPFTGDITHSISDGQISLLGNPYASALNAEQFILNNSNVIDGTLEFWDHFETTNSHNLDQYMGGYAKYNLVGMPTAAVNKDGGISNKIPTKYVPVGQGFFVTAKAGIASNSSITFNNSQRAFVKEDDIDGMQMFGIPDGTNSTAGTFDGPTKIKLNLITPENYNHQIAIGFMQDKATEAIDYGYDAILRDTDPNQFYFMHPEAKLLIQGVGYFDEDKKYPLGVIAEVQGRYTFSIDQFENLGEHTPVYLYDNEKQIYHNLRKSDYIVNLTKGEHNTRFSLRFKNHNLESNLNAQEMLNTIVVYRQNDHVVISNPAEQITVLNARMYNVLGQEVSFWNISNGRESHIELPLSTLARGIYVVQVQTDNGTVSKKISIR